MTVPRKRNTPPFTRRGLSYENPAKHFWKRFRSESTVWEDFATQSRKWHRFSAVLCGRNAGLLELLFGASVDQRFEAGTTQSAVVQQMAGSGVESIPIEFLSSTLADRSLPDPFRLAGSLTSLLDSIARLHPDMWWWVSDRGLVMANIDAEAVIVLSGFNQLAGGLFYRNAVADRLSQSALIEIARELDTAGYQLKENLQPAHWREIAIHNQKFSRQAIKTFEKAVTHPFSAHFVRKRLYVARDAYRRLLLDVR